MSDPLNGMIGGEDGWMGVSVIVERQEVEKIYSLAIIIR